MTTTSRCPWQLPASITTSVPSRPQTMQEIMDEELAQQLQEQEHRALEQTYEDINEEKEAVIFGQAHADDHKHGVLLSADSDEFQDDLTEQDEEDWEEDDELDYSGGKHWGSGATAGKGFTSLRETLRRQEKDESRKSVQSGASSELAKFAQRDSAFDDRTVMVLQKLINTNQLVAIQTRVHTGREANIYHALGADAETGRELHYALKIFKTARADYTKSMYNECDPTGRRYDIRFVKKSIRRQLKLWTEKEYKHLTRAFNCGVNAPIPVLMRDHVLIMGFIGTDDGKSAGPLKDAILTYNQLCRAYVDILRSIRKLYHGARLVHGTLHEANILYHKHKCWFTNFGQAVDRSQAEHEELLDRDLENLHRFCEEKQLRRATKDRMGMLSLASAREYVITEKPEEIIHGYNALMPLFFPPDETMTNEET